MNFALFGGTFDPVHRGHLAVARAVLADPRFALDRLYFLPAAKPPHKMAVAMTPFKHRYEMLRLAISGEPKLAISEIEQPSASEPAPNYTIDTVRRFKASLRPDDQLFLVMGMDSLAQLSTWRDPVELLEECPFIAVSRPNFDRAAALAGLPKGAPRDRIYFLEEIAEEVSATDIRRAVSNGNELTALVGAPVAGYIREHGLYR